MEDEVRIGLPRKYEDQGEHITVFDALVVKVLYDPNTFSEITVKTPFGESVLFECDLECESEGDGVYFVNDSDEDEEKAVRMHDVVDVTISKEDSFLKTLSQHLKFFPARPVAINPKHGEAYGPLDPYVHHNPFVFATQQYDCLMEGIFHSILVPESLKRYNEVFQRVRASSPKGTSHGLIAESIIRQKGKYGISTTRVESDNEEMWSELWYHMLRSFYRQNKTTFNDALDKVPDGAFLFYRSHANSTMPSIMGGCLMDDPGYHWKFVGFNVIGKLWGRLIKERKKTVQFT